MVNAAVFAKLDSGNKLKSGEEIGYFDFNARKDITRQGMNNETGMMTAKMDRMNKGTFPVLFISAILLTRISVKQARI